jgi:hypothetical protein
MLVWALRCKQILFDSLSRPKAIFVKFTFFPVVQLPRSSRPTVRLVIAIAVRGKLTANSRVLVEILQ